MGWKDLSLVLLGAVMIGGSAGALLWLTGRIAGNSGIVAGAFEEAGPERRWRLMWLAGLVAGGLVLVSTRPLLFEIAGAPPVTRLAVAGLLVGFGTRLGNGCTSGHGICGVARLSKRSVVATLVFFVTAAAALAGARVWGA